MIPGLINAEYGSIAAHSIDNLTIQAQAWRAVSWPHQVGVVPRQAECFQHRSAVDGLDEAVAGGGTAVLCQVLAGLGGVGKTQLAAHYARNAWRSGTVDLLIWVTAASRRAILAAYAQAGIEVANADAANPQQAIARFLAWLEITDKRWLVVLDDLSDPADLRGLWPPHHLQGRVVVTTRRRDAALTGEGRRLVEVGLFTSGEAATYMTAKLAAHGRSDDPGQITGLADDLGYLPLALAQASAYIIDLNLACAAYRRRLVDRRRTLPDLVPDHGGLPDDHRATLASTWSLSIERADQLRPSGLARPMLQLASVLDPNGIPANVLMSSPALTYAANNSVSREVTTRTRGQHSMPTIGVDDAADALRSLHRLSLVDHNADSPYRAIRIHALIQRATRELLTDDQGADLTRAAADALYAVWPQVERETDLAQSLRANTDALTTNFHSALWQPRGHAVLFRAGQSLNDAGLISTALTYWQSLYVEARRHLGADHRDTFVARHNLADLRGESGDPAGAVAAFAQLLEDRSLALGASHPDTLVTRHKLAYWRGKAGHPADAARSFEQLLADQLRVLGPDHPDTLATRHNLARWRGEAGDPGGAVEATEQLLQDRQRILGPDHPDTLTTRSNLAYWRGKAGDPAGAVAAFARLLDDRLRVLGPDHPHTLNTRHNLARWRGEAGDAAGAARAFERVVQDRQRVLGADHPDNLNTRHNLARWRGEAGDQSAAVATYEHLLHDLVRVLGPDHPHTFATRHNLARWRGAAGDAAGAVTDLRQLLDDLLRVLGPDHPHTVATKQSYTYWTESPNLRPGETELCLDWHFTESRAPGNRLSADYCQMRLKPAGKSRFV